MVSIGVSGVWDGEVCEVCGLERDRARSGTRGEERESVVCVCVCVCMNNVQKKKMLFKI
jgi:hypothetical protein